MNSDNRRLYSTYLKVNSRGDNLHGLSIVPKDGVGTKAVLPPFVKLFQPRHATLADLLWQEVIFRYLLNRIEKLIKMGVTMKVTTYLLRI